MKIKQISTYQCDGYKKFIESTNKHIRENKQIQFKLGYCMEINLKGVK